MNTAELEKEAKRLSKKSIALGNEVEKIFCTITKNLLENWDCREAEIKRLKQKLKDNNA